MHELGPLTQLNEARRASAADQAVAWDRQTLAFDFISSKDPHNIFDLFHDVTTWPRHWKFRRTENLSGDRWIVSFDIHGAIATAGDGAQVRSIINLLK